VTLRAVALVALLLTACSTDRENKATAKADYHYQLASGYYFDQNSPMAIQELDTALVLNPRHEQAHFLMAFISMGRRQYTQAIVHLKSALEIKPDYFEARENLGAVYLAMQRWDEAIATLEPLLVEHLYATPYLLHNNLGFAYRNKKAYDEAIRHFSQAVFLNPRFCLGLYNLGETFLIKGETADAVRQFKKAIDKCPTYADPYYKLAVVFEKRGRETEALDYYRLCIKHGGESPVGERCRTRVEGDVL
jgi:Tfp pilus assembly protein PilF